MVVSAAFALLAWRGIGEKRRQEAEERAAYRADVQTATEAALAAQSESQKETSS
jgi:hypothetical protein